MKNMLLKNWTFWRAIRMAFSILFIFAGIFKNDFLLIAGGVFLFFHALSNVCSACAGGSCEIPKE